MTCPLCGGPIVNNACARCGLQGRRIDNFVMCEVGVPVDIGWGTVVLNANETVTRRCKGCRAIAVSRVSPTGEVARVPFVHDDDCPIVDRLGNNPGLS